MTFQERMTVALARSKQRQTQTQTVSPVAARNQANKTPTTEQYRTATLERVLTKMKLMKETI
ncbi:hypothetical protein [Pseudomonas bubulae]|uniref:hypothetical protein n=1 Tax=Pseudomonas bubulae TaxID=2316085 RepID=UPI0039A067B7